MLDQLKGLCKDDDDDACVEERERLARDIIEVSSDDDWADDTVIFAGHEQLLQY